MIWVIGDIHGMFDPLKRLISMIQAQHNSGNSVFRVKKLIFIGDYIDFGPSSKEVIDYIMGLPFEKVCMMGNHDDLMLQFIDNSDLIQKFGNVWFRGNGGQRTVSSFSPDVFYMDNDENMTREEFRLDNIYIDFFRNLKITHTEQLGDHKLAFVHAMFNKEFSLEEQLAIKTYDDYHAWRKENKVWIENTLLWNRDEPKKKFGDYIVVHGHIPTPKLHGVWGNLHGYDTKLEMPFLKFEEKNKDDVSFYGESYVKGYTGESDQMISVNVDTGAVYGYRLTAAGFSEDMFDEAHIMVQQVSVGKGYRLSQDFHTYQIRFPGF